ncbi:2,3-diaminopropionate biosynthesis protein SbnB [Aquimarina sp. Aq78]|uniref:2,3-diaminopropionate biosynthesis protein SbnB n=1 Tax=Aquimarina sp. Aq78 TaxID=1191889 RepID=UPI000D0EF9F9|nr:2,3-diaminopropionate biosynthesis protein SbnB [Aquimarina sp. Aq78]
MIYLNEKDLFTIGLNWKEFTETIREGVRCLNQGESVQPIKPYLRFKDIKNRIIAMPAYLGNDFDVAGIKWIASFPDNIKKNKARANCVTILNHADTGEPICIINTQLISVLRTTTVSRLMIEEYCSLKKIQNPKIGIIGFGPIGKYHLAMCQDYFKDDHAEFFIYDLNGVRPEDIDMYDNVTVVDDWYSAYKDADVFMTCTVSNERYIDKKPKENSLHLNVSLRDYKTEQLDYFKDGIIVDKWKEICRENTDIEAMHKERNLVETDVKSIEDVVINKCLKDMVDKTAILFNPMGMAIFDIALGHYFYNKSKELKVGAVL